MLHISLHYACQLKYIESDSLPLVEYLIQNKCDKDARDNSGKTPLHCACISSNFQVVRFLTFNPFLVNINIYYFCQTIHN